MINVALSVDGRAEDLASLEEWLRSEPKLRGRIERGHSGKSVGAMGGTTDLIVALATSSTLTIVARSLQVWLTQRTSDLTFEISSKDGTKRSFAARRIKDPHAFAREVLEAFDSTSGHDDGTTDRQ